MKKINFLNILITILIISIVVVIGIIIKKYMSDQKADETMAEVIQNIEVLQQAETEESKEELQNVMIDGYKVIGILEIPSINIKYPIIDHTDDVTMNISVTKFWGGEINSIGNFTIAGHNNLNGTMFGKVKSLKKGDIIKLSDLYGNTVEYKIFDTYVIEPTDVECVKSVQNDTREVTLITCTNGRKNRLVTKAREVL